MRNVVTIAPLLEEALAEQEPGEDLEDAVFRVVARHHPDDAALHAATVISLLRRTADRDRLTPEAAARRIAAGANGGGGCRTEVLTVSVTSVGGIPTEISIDEVRASRGSPPRDVAPGLSADLVAPAGRRGDSGPVEPAEPPPDAGPPDPPTADEPPESLARPPLAIPDDPAPPAPAWMIALLVVLFCALLAGAGFFLLAS